MLWSFFVPAMLAVTVAAVLTLRRYAAPSAPPHVRAIVLVAWITSASTVALVPVDVYAALSGDAPGALPGLWAAAYWTTQLLTWSIIPLAQCASDAGDFTPLTRLRTAALDCARFYGAVAAAAAVGVLLLLAAGRLHWGQLPGLAVVLVNAYGLAAIVLLLGFGLVAIPRRLWRASFPEARLTATYWRVGSAAARLAAEAAEARAVAAVVAATAAAVPRRDPLRPAADAVLAQAEAAAPYKPSSAPRDAGGRAALDGLTDADLDYGADGLAGLAALRRRLIRSTGAFNGVRAQYVAAVEEALRLEAAARARAAGDAALAVDPAAAAAAGPLARARAAATVFVAPLAMRAAAVALAALSATVVWSEATIGVRADVSPFSRALHGAAGRTPLGAHVLAGAPLAYMAASAYLALFSLGVFPFYRVVAGATEPRSLLANAGQVSRFAAPLAYNFLHVVRMVGGDGSTPTVFSKIMAPAMRDVPVFGASFNTWFPPLVAAHVALLVADAWGAAAAALLPARFHFGGRGDGEGERDGPLVERGRALARDEAAARARGGRVGDALAAVLDGDSSEAPPGRPGSETELQRTPPRGGGGVAGWLTRAVGGGATAAAGPAAAARASPSSNTARRLAALSPLTRSLLGGGGGGGGGEGERAALLGAGRGDAGGARPPPPPASSLYGSGAAAAPVSGLDAVFSRMDGGGRVDDEEESGV